MGNIRTQRHLTSLFALTTGSLLLSGCVSVVPYDQTTTLPPQETNTSFVSGHEAHLYRITEQIGRDPYNSDDLKMVRDFDTQCHAEGDKKGLPAETIADLDHKGFRHLNCFIDYRALYYY